MIIYICIRDKIVNKNKYYLFFDTETIGVPADFNVPFPEGSVQIILQFNPNNLATLFFSMK